MSLRLSALNKFLWAGVISFFAIFLTVLPVHTQGTTPPDRFSCIAKVTGRFALQSGDLSVLGSLNRLNPFADEFGNLDTTAVETRVIDDHGLFDDTRENRTRCENLCNVSFLSYVNNDEFITTCEVTTFPGENQENRQWTCAWATEQDNKKIWSLDQCKDLRDRNDPIPGNPTNSFPNEDRARTACYQLCEAFPNQYAECLFVISRDCRQLISGSQLIGGAGLQANNPFSLPTDEIRRLRNLSARASSPSQLVGQIIKLLLSVAGSVALAIFVYGGLTWMAARGNSERVAKATKILLWGALGVLAMLSSYAVVDFIVESVAFDERAAAQQQGRR